MYLLYRLVAEYRRQWTIQDIIAIMMCQTSHSGFDTGSTADQDHARALLFSLAVFASLQTHLQHFKVVNPPIRCCAQSMASEKTSVAQSNSRRTSVCCSHDSLFLLVMWTQILNSWDGHHDKQLATDLSYLHPIPDELRSTAWFVISGARSLMKRHRNLYQSLSRRNPQKECLEDIEKDLRRTFSSKSMTDRYSDKLYRILAAYSVHDPSVSYAQGMNFVASFILRQYF